MDFGTTLPQKLANEVRESLALYIGYSPLITIVPSIMGLPVLPFRPSNAASLAVPSLSHGARQAVIDSDTNDTNP